MIQFLGNHNLFVSHFIMGCKEAIKDFTQAVNIDPKNPVYLHNRGCCYRNMGELELSIQDFDMAI